MGIKLPWQNGDQPDYALIAENLVDTAAQLTELNPQLASLEVGKPRSNFERAVVSELSDRGYTIGPAGESEGSKQVFSQISSKADDSGTRQELYVLQIGDMSFERSYDTLAERTVPVSELTIRGGNGREVELDDDIFEVPNSPYSDVVYENVVEPTVDEMLKPITPVRGKGLWRTSEAGPVKKNMYETMVSNYQDIFSSYSTVEQSILVFPNDSLRLGEANKHIIEQFVSQMDQETDVLSVIGCSHGPTAINNGNSLLALGRANRVKEALLFSGVNHEHVLEEGCWAPQNFDAMPQRGVVLTLKRKVDS
ncbi:MAG: hypothetical protein AB8B63_21625 [Granulosicoccus sp.]